MTLNTCTDKKNIYTYIYIKKKKDLSPVAFTSLPAVADNCVYVRLVSAHD